MDAAVRSERPRKARMQAANAERAVGWSKEVAAG
jgi:hypothetical protein